MTNRLGLVLALALAACSSRGVSIGGDGGIDCTTLDEPSCRSDSRCVAYSPCCCGNAIRCVAAGTPAPVCTGLCTSNRCTDVCAGRDEATCNSMQACIADYCTECSCTPTFVGCRLPTKPKTMCPALGCPLPNCGCDGLSESACKAAPSTMGCTPNYCPDCHGGQTFAGCTGPTEGAPACPQVCANGCHSQSDCANTGQVCLYPGEPLCGGACLMPPPCNSDGECGGGSMICDLPTCSCTGTKTCTQGCNSVADCGAAQICDGTHRCVAQPCGTCPSHFVCASGGCQRQTCTGDASCGTGYCVSGHCYDTLGTCSFLPG